MSPESLYGLVLLAAAAHAIWNALVKRAADALLMMAAIRLVGLVFGLAVVPFLPWPDESTWVLLALACTATFAYYGLLIRCYQIGDLSLVYPVARGSAPLILALIAFFAIDEELAATQIAGIILISVGILTLVIGKGGDRRAVGYALATGISIATYSFLGGLGVRSSASVFGFQAWLEILTGIGMLAFAMIRRPGKVQAFVETSGGIGLIAGALSVAGYLAFLTAAKVLPLAPIAALRECGLIFGAIIGAVVFKEAFWYPPHRCGESRCGRRDRNSYARVLLGQDSITPNQRRYRDKFDCGVYRKIIIQYS
jgi:drug/metabolite transporter (DMT)-like permease